MAVDTPSVSPALRAQMAEILEVTGKDEIDRLGQRVEAALRDYRKHSGAPRPSPKKLQRTFKKLSSSTVKLLQAMRGLGPTEQQLIYDSLQERRALGAQGGLAHSDAVAALDAILLTLRVTAGSLPPVCSGRPRDTARWLFVHRLACIYATVRPGAGDGRYERPTRIYDVTTRRETGRFHSFVLLVLDAYGCAETRQGIDDVIRSVVEGMGKNRV